MPRIAATKPPPGGRHLTKSEVERRLAHVETMLRAGRTRAEVVASMTSTFGCSARSADDYMRRARQRWTEESRDTREVERVASLARLAEKAEKRGAFAAAVSAEKLRAQINGLLAPVELRATVQPLAVESRPDPTYEDAIEELEAIRQLLSTSDLTALQHRDERDAKAPTTHRSELV